MKVLSGHLTQNERKIIKQMIDQGLTQAQAGRKFYRINQDGNEYQAEISQRDRGIGLIGSELRVSTYRSRFSL